MNKHLSAILLALATSSLLAIGCGSTASLEETEADSLVPITIPQITDGDEAATDEEPGLEAEYMESEAPVYVIKHAEPQN